MVQPSLRVHAAARCATQGLGRRPTLPAAVLRQPAGASVPLGARVQGAREAAREMKTSTRTRVATGRRAGAFARGHCTTPTTFCSNKGGRARHERGLRSLNSCLGVRTAGPVAREAAAAAGGARTGLRSTARAGEGVALLAACASVLLTAS